MANNRELLKEALADAKSLREMAITNAKAALEESFTPQIKTMLSAKLQEMEDNDLKEEDDVYEMKDDKEEKMKEDLNLDEILAELEEADDSDEKEPVKEVDEVETEEAEEDGDMDMEEEDEPMDLEDMSEDDLKGFIESVIADMVEAGDLEAGEDMEGEDMEGEMEDMDDEEEVNIDELLAEIESMDEEYKYEEDDKDSKMEEMSTKYEEDDSKVDEMYKSYEEDDKDSKMEEMSKMYDEDDSKMEEAELDEILGFGKDKIGPALEAFMEKHKAEFAKLKDDPSNRDTQKDLIMKLAAFKPELRKLAGGDAGGAYKKISDMITNIQSNDSRSLLQKLATGTGGSVALRRATAESLQTELNEALEANKVLSTELNEAVKETNATNLLNAKLLFTNKIFKSKNLNESQKVKVLSSFDKANTVKETKLVYETLNEGLKVKKSTIKENLGRASKMSMVPTTKKPIVESNDVFARMQKLAGLK